MEIKPIETKYKGYRFRSRLEARWAVFFDVLGIEWEYEPEGYEFDDGTMYLPDFYLPKSKQYFEVKGIMTEKDMHKIEKMLDNGKDVVIGYSDFTFQSCADYTCCEEGNDFYLERKIDSELCCCPECHKLFFHGITGSWCCRCCRTYLGDERKVLTEGDLDYETDKKVEIAISKARQARFEHGENPA